MKFNKAAMFGLDARIALAIFGALSVISGAALYSAIQKSKTVAQVTIINELTKAIEQYIIDTGSYLPEADPASNRIESGNLYENFENIAGWNGPYYGKKNSSKNKLRMVLTNSSYIDLSFGYDSFRQSNEDWGSAGTSVENCTNSNCFIYLSTYKVNEYAKIIHNTFTRLDEYVDGGDGKGLGKIRGNGNGTTAFSLYIELFPEYRSLN